jgi:hypothetical protein
LAYSAVQVHKQVPALEDTLADKRREDKTQEDGVRADGNFVLAVQLPHLPQLVRQHQLLYHCKPSAKSCWPTTILCRNSEAVCSFQKS